MISKDTVQSVKNNPIILARLLFSWLQDKGTPIVVNKIDQKMYIYNGKFYQELVDERDHSDLDRIFYTFIVEFDIMTVWKSAKLSELKRALISSPDCQIVEMDGNPNIMCLKNGLLNIDKMEFFGHNSNHYISTYIDVEYTKEAKPATKFVNFLNSCFTDQTGKIDADSVSSLIDIGGYILYPKNVIEKMFMFLGEGANGKSLLMYVYEMFFDPKVVTHISLENISDARGFLREGLVTSRLNIATEAKEKGIDVEEIKKIISGEGTTIYRKYKGQIDIFCKSKQIIASNTKPYFNDTTNGIYRRLFIVEFKNRFVDQEEYDSYKNPKLHRVFIGRDKQELFKEFRDEKNAIFFLFLSALKRLRARGFKILETDNAKSIKAEYRETNDSLGSWLTDNYEVDYGEYPIPVAAKDILQEYRKWHNENVSEKLLNMSAKLVGTRIRDLFRVEYIRYAKDGKLVSGFPLLIKTHGNNILQPGIDFSDEVSKDLQMARQLFS